MIPRLRFHGSILASMILGMVFAGCDDPRPPKDLVASRDRQPAAAVTRPSAAEMARAPRKTLDLPGMPLSIEAPDSWTTEATSSGGCIVRGPTPNGPPPDGTLQIVVTHLPRFPSDSMKTMQEREKQEKGDQIKSVEVRTIAPATLIDRRAVVAATPDGRVPAMLDWRVSVYLPDDAEHYVTAILHFTNLTVEQYDLDKDLLGTIIASLKYDASADSSHSPR